MVHFSHDVVESDIHNNDTEMVLKRRLAKALQVASNLKSKTLMEQEVNKELARRNADVRAKNLALEKQVEDMKDVLLNIESVFAQLQIKTLEHIPESKCYVARVVVVMFYTVHLLGFLAILCR
jgi:3-hydroxyacyl-CoA dehydrogenase